MAIRIRVDGNGANAQLVAGTQNPHRDLAAIGNKELIKSFRYKSFSSHYLSNQWSVISGQ
jgi:hypothetical protein